jgi:hypothetical protein
MQWRAARGWRPARARRGRGSADRWQRSVDIVAFIRAVQPRFFDRFTKTKAIRFAVYRVHASEAAALQFALKDAGELPGAAELRIKHLAPVTNTIFRARRAGWLSHTPEVIGVATRTIYQVQTGAIDVLTQPGSGNPDPVDPEVEDAGIDGGIYGQSYVVGAGVDGGHYRDNLPFGSTYSIDAGSYV